MKKNMYISGFIFLFFLICTYIGLANQAQSDITFHPIKHATMVIESKKATIYVDPVGDAALFAKYPKPDIILITDIHNDHFSKEVINFLLLFGITEIFFH